MTLTDTRVRNTKPAAKPLRLFDERGLYLEISPAGGKWWRLKYRFGGEEKRLSLDVYPDVSLKDARDRRDEARKLLDDGEQVGRWQELVDQACRIVQHSRKNSGSAHSRTFSRTLHALQP